MKSTLKITLNSLLGFLLSTQALAYNVIEYDINPAHPWSITASLGFGETFHMMNQDGQTALGRLAFGHQLAQLGEFNFGAEIGVQNGNQMRFDIPQSTLDLLGGETIGGRINPMLDGLLTLFIPLSTSDMPINAIFKAGGVYRQLQMERKEIGDLSQLSPELQAGVGFSVSDTLSLHATYQQIFGANPNFKINPLTGIGTIANLPTQKSVLFGLTFLF